MTYELLEQPWVPTAGPGGLIDRSVRRVLAEAHELHGLAALPATVNVAILRQVLLPIVLDAFGPPRSIEELGERLRAGSVDLAILDDYLDRFAHRFDLFHPTEPFGQVAELATAKGEVKGIGLIVPTEASGNNVPLFAPRSEGGGLTLSPAEATRWLLHTQCYDTAAIKSGAVGDAHVKSGKTVGNPTGPVGRFGAVVPIGRTLYETLILNLPIRDAGLAADDRPWWDRPHPTASWSSRPAAGLIDLLTWQSRRVRLVYSGDDASATVHGVVLCAGDRLDPFPVHDPVEPHCAWTIDAKPKPGEPERRPQRHQAGRASWQGFKSLIARAPGTGAGHATSQLLQQVGELWSAGQLELGYPLNVDLAGIEYGNMSAIVEHIVHDALPLPVAALRATSEVGPTLDLVASDADELIKILNGLEGDVRRALGSDLLPWDKGERATARFVHQLDQLVRRLLRGMQLPSPAPHSYDTVIDAWHAEARRLTLAAADDVLAQVPSAAFQGRLVTGSDKKERRYNVATAELRFRSKLRELVGDGTFPAPDSAEEESA